jgi:hypothetical protein
MGSVGWRKRPSGKRAPFGSTRRFQTIQTAGTSRNSISPTIASAFDNLSERVFSAEAIGDVIVMRYPHRAAEQITL